VHKIWFYTVRFYAEYVMSNMTTSMCDCTPQLWQDSFPNLALYDQPTSGRTSLKPPVVVSVHACEIVQWRVLVSVPFDISMPDSGHIFSA